MDGSGGLLTRTLTRHTFPLPGFLPSIWDITGWLCEKCELDPFPLNLVTSPIIAHLRVCLYHSPCSA